MSNNTAPNEQSGAASLTDEEARLDAELEIIEKMKQAFAAGLHMLEAARDDLVEMGNRMDRLRHASELCRKALEREKGRKES